MSIEQQISNVNSRQLKRNLLRVAHAGLVALIKGSPGIGKSAIVREVAEELNLKVIDHRLSTSAPEDLSGLPRFDEDGKARFAPFADLFPLEGEPLPEKSRTTVYGKPDEVETYDGWLLFLDELTSAHKDVIAAGYKLILDKMVGQHKLHSNVLIVAAGNKETDRAIVNKIGTAMESRVVTFNLQVDFNEWLTQVAIKQKYDGRIIAFLSMYESKLYDFDPSKEGKYCCPRTWEFMNKMIEGQPVTDEDSQLFAGTITPAVGVEFISFCRLYDKLVRIEEIVKDPQAARIPAERELQFATMVHLFEKADERNYEKVVEYVMRLQTTFQILFFRGIKNVNEKLFMSPASAKGIMAIGKFLN